MTNLRQCKRDDDPNPSRSRSIKTDVAEPRSRSSVRALYPPWSHTSFSVVAGGRIVPRDEISSVGEWLLLQLPTSLAAVLIAFSCVEGFPSVCFNRLDEA